MNRIIFLVMFLFQSCYATQFLAISDIHYGSHNKSQDGQDTGTEFLAITLNKFKKLSSNVDFILNLGDLPTHLLFFTAKKGEYERVLFHALYEADPRKPMFYITGNNDSLGGNYQPFEVNGKSPLNFAPDWTGACLYCKHLLIDDSNMRHSGYYSSYVIPNNKEIILIALNTMPWANKPAFLSPYPNRREDALKELAWLEHQLKTHHAKQLLIAMHIPPGTTHIGNKLWEEEYLQRFIHLLGQYYHHYEQISLLSGHTHMDEIRKIAIPGKGFIYIYGVPGISRIHHNNPGMKIFTMNQNMIIKNYTTYYTSSFTHWDNESYSALGAKGAIFPYCGTKNLAQCLNSLSDKQVCHDLEKGLFYGVKSARVHQGVCKLTYRV